MQQFFYLYKCKYFRAMKKVIILFGCVVLLFAACKNKEKNGKTNELVNNDTVPFYLYIVEINKELDSLQHNNKLLSFSTTDSSGKNIKSTIDFNQFKLFATSFLQKDITQKPIKQFYKETIFNDLTTVSTVMNYTTNKDSLPVKSVDVLLNAKNNSEVKRVDMKVIYDKSDSVITENYSWIFKKGFNILRYAQAANGKGVATKMNFSWEK